MREILFKAKRIDNDEWLEELNSYKLGECMNDCQHYDNCSNYIYSKGYRKAIDDVVKTLIPRLTDAIYPKDVEGMKNLINDVAEQLKEGSADNEV